MGLVTNKERGSNQGGSVMKKAMKTWRNAHSWMVQVGDTVRFVAGWAVVISTIALLVVVLQQFMQYLGAMAGLIMAVTLPAVRLDAATRSAWRGRGEVLLSGTGTFKGARTWASIVAGRLRDFGFTLLPWEHERAIVVKHFVFRKLGNGMTDRAVLLKEARISRGLVVKSVLLKGKIQEWIECGPYEKAYVPKLDKPSRSPVLAEAVKPKDLKTWLDDRASAQPLELSAVAASTPKTMSSFDEIPQHRRKHAELETPANAGWFRGSLSQYVADGIKASL
jgi:hypothetical protein